MFLCSNNNIYLYLHISHIYFGIIVNIILILCLIKHLNHIIILHFLDDFNHHLSNIEIFSGKINFFGIMF